MLLTAVFLFNLLCGLVPCDPNFGQPTISLTPPPEIGWRDGGALNKSLIPAKVTFSGNRKVQGYHMKTVGGRTIFAFEGLPYGRAERWKSPTLREPWRGTWMAMRPGSDCLQISAPKFIRVYGSEDCLFVNVFSPDLPYKGRSSGYPVIVYFHSGSFLMGTGSEHGPAYMLDEDVVLVTVNNRVGVLGFLSTGDSALPGNYGLKDQALAIEWTHQNIASFGGDPNNINLVGYSAGGISVHLHMISNRTRHLFRRGVSLGSGSAFQHWAVQSGERAKYYANRVARRFNCPRTNLTQPGSSFALLDCLRSIPVNTLVADQLNLFDWFPFPPVLMAPVVEPPSPDAFLVETPTQAYQRGGVAKKPWINGMTSHEGLTAVLVLELFMRWLAFRLNWKLAAKSYLDIGYLTNSEIFPNAGNNATAIDEIVEKITKIYLAEGQTPLSGNQFQFARMLTHRMFHFGVIKGLEAHSSVAPTYSYYFSFNKGRYSMGNLFGHKSSEWAPGHAEDEYFWFNTSTQHPGFKESDPDYKMSKVMMNLLANFVTTGEPKYTTDEGKVIKIWEPVTAISTTNSVGKSNEQITRTRVPMLRLDQKVEMIDYPDMKAMKFWQDLKLEDMIPWLPFS